MDAKGLRYQQVAAAAMGNALEWYDFLIYGFLTTTIAKLFFPTASDGTGVLLTLATFGVAFVFRPVGGVILGYWADRRGRASALVLIVTVMTVSSLMLAVAPTYAVVGVAAPIIVLAARILQGLSVGGEFASATSFLVEHAPPGHRGLYSAWQTSSQGIAFLLAGAVCAAVTLLLDAQTFENWGWRIPFAVGLLIGPLTMYLRRNLVETPEFAKARAAHTAGGELSELLTTHLVSLVTSIGVVAGGAATIYILLLYMPTYGIQVLKLNPSFSFVSVAVSGLILTAITPLAGALSDRIGWRPIMVGTLCVYLATLYPLFSWLTAAPSVARLLIVQVFFAALMACFNGPFGNALAGVFPARIRSTALSVAYNVGVTLFGGFAPFAVSWYIARTGDQMAPVYFASLGVVVGLFAALKLAPASRVARPANAAATVVEIEG